MNILNENKNGILIFDGAMGTNLSRLKTKEERLKTEDRRPKTFDGKLTADSRQLSCSEAYNLFAPEIVKAVHESFLRSGVDVIETNTFNANRISLKEFGLEDRVQEIVSKSIAIAKEAASTVSKKIYISGDIGPTNKLPSLGQISFDELYNAYKEVALCFIKEGVDLIQICTCQDMLQLKTAIIACKDAFKETNTKIPIIASITIDRSGKMLLGTDVDAVLATLVPLDVAAIGMNCGLGPDGMEESIRILCKHSPLPVIIMPNAGLPKIKGKETVYDLKPEIFAEKMKYFVKELGVQMVGGCCGTTDEHIKELVKNVKDLKPKERKVDFNDSLSSLYSRVEIKQMPSPLIIGERMNINGSKKFRELMLKENYEEAAMMAVNQSESGSHVIDISVSYAGRDEAKDMYELLSLVVKNSNLPVCIDSTNADVIDLGLKILSGRSVINSINLEDGGTKAKRVLELAASFGAGVIALTIDEKGMAKDCELKCKIADRLIELSKKYGIKTSSLFIDPLTFTLADPKAASFGSGKETLEAIKKIKKKHKNVNIILGVSNISYGFKKAARKVLNSVFLHEAVATGLNAAIVHASQIIALDSINKEMKDLSLDLIWNKRKDALEKFTNYFEDNKLKFDEISEDLIPDKGVHLSIIRGDKSGVVNFIDKLVKVCPPKDILNNILLPAMAEVGKKFDKGEIPLPFVLKSAEAMKAATDELSKHLDPHKNVSRGKIVLATVRGDVHDIGKNLVDIILTNNGFEVLNLGVKQSVENIIKAAEESKADVIGLSGLLVESALIMKDDLAHMSHKGISVPVICGGAALTKSFVEKDLRRSYKGKVYYAKDAFDGLKIVQGLVVSDQ